MQACVPQQRCNNASEHRRRAMRTPSAFWAGKRPHIWDHISVKNILEFQFPDSENPRIQIQKMPGKIDHESEADNRPEHHIGSTFVPHTHPHTLI
jgi:hypothetical protein